MPKLHVLFTKENLDPIRLQGKVVIVLAAMLLRRGCDAQTALNASRVGRMMTAHALQHEVDCAAQANTLDVVPRLDDGRLHLVAA